MRLCTIYKQYGQKNHTVAIPGFQLLSVGAPLSGQSLVCSVQASGRWSVVGRMVCEKLVLFQKLSFHLSFLGKTLKTLKNLLQN